MVRVQNSSEYKIVNRIINGKRFQSLRPASYRYTKNPAARMHHAQFGLAAHLASYLKRFNVLYQCWKVAKLEGTRGYNRIISYNYKKMTPEGPTESVMITPPGFNPPFKELFCSAGMIRIVFDDAFKINPDTDVIVVIMILFDPKQKMKCPYLIRQVHYTHLFTQKLYTFNLDNFRDISRYKKFIVYSAVMRKTQKKLSWSSTLAQLCEL